MGKDFENRVGTPPPRIPRSTPPPPAQKTEVTKNKRIKLSHLAELLELEKSEIF